MPKRSRVVGILLFKRRLREAEVILLRSGHIVSHSSFVYYLFRQTIAIHRVAIALAPIAWLHGIVALELSVMTAMNDA